MNQHFIECCLGPCMQMCIAALLVKNSSTFLNLVLQKLFAS